MSEEKFQALYKNTKKEEIIKELYFKCKANYELENIIKEVRKYIDKNGLFSVDTYNFCNGMLKILDKENK